MAEREGYKIVRSDGSSTVGTPPVTYVVGATYRLPPGVQVVPCKVGFHYCPVASDCTDQVSWADDRRLLKVAALPDATVVTNDDVKYACSGLVVVADVTNDVDVLLAATERWQDGRRVDRFDDNAPWFQRVTESRTRGRLHADDGAAYVYRDRGADFAEKRWYRNGLLWLGYDGRSSWVQRRGGHITALVAGTWTVVPSDDAEYAKMDAMLDRVEPCECA
jgi:hypothetical protein